MSDDVCDCGVCHVDACDRCGGPVACVDDEGEAWCAACLAIAQERRDEAVWLRQWEASQ
jgi:hypothetical protein